MRYKHVRYNCTCFLYYANSYIFHLRYVSRTYPPVPATSGSLLSRDLVYFLASSPPHQLKSFSSLGVSLAIWLAPAGPNYIDDAAWSLSNASCSDASIAAGPFVAKDSIVQAWNNYVQCGKICSCK